MKSDEEIARQAVLQPISAIADQLGLTPEQWEGYGRYKAKIQLSAAQAKKARYILISAITPTSLGEGKTTTAIGLAMGLAHLGKQAVVTLRQPSLGPVFGIKGGAAGGGYAQVVPGEDFNLHLTGDMHAISIAHNLCAAFLDNALFHKNRLQINPTTITWGRVLDLCDRALSHVVTGLGTHPRESFFEITPASELMAIMALAHDWEDLRQRINRIVVAYDYEGQPVTTTDLQVAGAMSALLKEAFKPNLLQTLAASPCLVHTGPFANIAHGCSSVVADQIALAHSEYVVTESGFGADLGAEKFFNIKCRQLGFGPDAVGLVATIRALKKHSGRFGPLTRKTLPPQLLAEDVAAVRAGSWNLVRQIKNIRIFGVPVVVIINCFPTDTPAEIEAVATIAQEAGAQQTVCSRVYEQGAAGGVAMAQALMAACEQPAQFTYLYPLELPLEDKIARLAGELYGASGVRYTPQAKKSLKKLRRAGCDQLPICMAKTQYSFSHDPQMYGPPPEFILPIEDFRLCQGAGFVCVYAGQIRTMPGLPAVPRGQQVTLDHQGQIHNLF